MTNEYSYSSARYEKLETKLDVLGEHKWLKGLNVQLIKSDVGNAIIRDQELPIIRIPKMDDMFISADGTVTNIPLYPKSKITPAVIAVPAVVSLGQIITPAVIGSPEIPAQMTHEAMLRLIQDEKHARNALKHRNQQERDLIAYLQSVISDQQLSRLELNHDYIKHRDAQQSFPMFKTIMSVILCVTSILTVMVRIQTFFNLKQGTSSFSDFVKKLDEAKVRITADLEDPADPTKKGYVKIEHLCIIIFLLGIDQIRFKLLIDRVIERSKSARIDNISDLIHEFSLWDQKMYHTTASDTIDPGASLALAAPTTIIPTACWECKKPFKSKLSAKGNYTKRCDSCFKKFVTASKAAKEAQRVATVQSAAIIPTVEIPAKIAQPAVARPPLTARSLQRRQALVSMLQLLDSPDQDLDDLSTLSDSQGFIAMAQSLSNTDCDLDYTNFSPSHSDLFFGIASTILEDLDEDNTPDLILDSDSDDDNLTLDIRTDVSYSSMDSYWWSSTHTRNTLTHPTVAHHWLISIRHAHTSCPVCFSRVQSSSTGCTTSSLWIDTMLIACKRLQLCLSSYNQAHLTMVNATPVTTLGYDMLLLSTPVAASIVNNLLYMFSESTMTTLVPTDCAIRPLLQQLAADAIKELSPFNSNSIDFVNSLTTGLLPSTSFPFDRTGILATTDFLRHQLMDTIQLYLFNFIDFMDANQPTEVVTPSVDNQPCTDIDNSIDAESNTSFCTDDQHCFATPHLSSSTHQHLKLHIPAIEEMSSHTAALQQGTYVPECANESACDDVTTATIRDRSSPCLRDPSTVSYVDDDNHPNCQSAIYLRGIRNGLPRSQMTLIGPTLIRNTYTGELLDQTGTFSNRNIPDNTWFENYTGEFLLDFKKAEERAKTSCHVYGLIDGANCLTAASYMQDCLHEPWYNAKIEFDINARSYKVISTKPIAKFDEIYIDYGYFWTAERIAEFPWIQTTIDARNSLYVYAPQQVLVAATNPISNVVYLDNGASCSVLNDLHLLTDVTPITPFCIGGISGSQIMATHKGRYKHLPQKYNQAYYAPKLAVNLISLGHLQLKGASYAATTSADGRRRLVIFDGPTVVTSSYMAPNRLYPFNPASTEALINEQLLSYSTSSSIIEKLDKTISAPCIVQTAVDTTLLTSVNKSNSPVHATKSLTRDITTVATPQTEPATIKHSIPIIEPTNEPPPTIGSSATLTYFAKPDCATHLPITNYRPPKTVSQRTLSLDIDHLTKEEFHRAELAGEYHDFLCHASDKSLKHLFDTGSVPYCQLTSRDLDNHRKINGPCPHCIAGKKRKPSMKPSITPPAPYSGHTLCIDLDKLDTDTPGGKTQQLLSVDEKTGRLDVLGAASKSTNDLFECVFTLISRYNALNRYVQIIHIDAESALTSLKTRLAFIGIELIMSPAAQHQQRIERYTQTLNNRVTAVLSSLAFVLPGRYLLQLKSHVASCINRAPNEKSFPYTPLQLSERRPPAAEPKLSILKFGTTVMIDMGKAKRTEISLSHSLPFKHTPKAELAVCLGFSANHRGQYAFALANGTVVPRKSFDIVQCSPFNWPLKHTIQAKPLLPPPIPTEIDMSIPSRVNSTIQKFASPPSLISIQPPALPLSDVSIPSTRSLLPFSSKSLSLLPHLSPYKQSDVIHSPLAFPRETTGSLSTKLVDSGQPMSHLLVALEPPYSLDSQHTTTVAFACDQICSPVVSEEMSLKQALKHKDAFSHVALAVEKELTKVLKTKPVIREIATKDHQHDAIRIRSQMLIKIKTKSTGGILDKVSARLAAGGNRQPIGSYGATYAPTVDDSSTKLVNAAFLADAVKFGYHDQIHMPSFDVPGAFLNVLLDKISCPRQILMFLQPDLPHPLAGTWVEIIGALYGLKQSNNLFEADFRKQFIKAGFNACPSDPCVYIKFHPQDPKLKCIVNVHVDDGQAIHNCSQLYNELVQILEHRYGPLEHHTEADSFLGQTILRNTHGALSYDMEGYIMKLAHLHQIDLNEISLTPSNPDLFHAPSNTNPYPLRDYQALIGGLIYVLKTRYDVRKEILHLATRTSGPTVSDYLKARKVLVYLVTTKHLGPTYFTDEGAVLSAHADASFGVHTDGRSHSGYYISIGRYSAPICCYSKSQQSCVTLSSMEAEYVCLTECGKKITHFRALLEDIGFPQLLPTSIFEDNKSAIDLTKAPQIPRKSRHINIRHHYIRELVHLNIVQIHYLPTTLMTADLLTKPLATSAFIPFRNQLLNTANAVKSAPFSYLAALLLTDYA